MRLTVAAAEFDGLTACAPGPWPLEPGAEWERTDGPLERHLTREILLFGGEDSEARLHIPLGPSGDVDAAFQCVLGDVVPTLLPHPRWDALLPALLAQAATFVRGEDRVRYGTWPSVYDSDVGGPSEALLLDGLAMWGATAFALRSARPAPSPHREETRPEAAARGCLESALSALRAGDRGAFHATLVGLQAAAMDRDLHTFGEAGPRLRAPQPPQPWLPFRPGSADPCLGGPGVLLQLLRSAIVTELPEADGRLGKRLLVLGGVPPAWWDQGDLSLEAAPTLAGPVSITARMDGGRLRVSVRAPGAEAVVVRRRDGGLHVAPGGHVDVTL